jgi:hypothetical protein
MQLTPPADELRRRRIKTHGMMMARRIAASRRSEQGLKMTMTGNFQTL